MRGTFSARLMVAKESTPSEVSKSVCGVLCHNTLMQLTHCSYDLSLQPELTLKPSSEVAHATLAVA